MNDFYQTSIPDEDVPPDFKKVGQQKVGPEAVAIKQPSLEIQPQPARQQSNARILPLVILVVACGLVIITVFLLAT